MIYISVLDYSTGNNCVIEDEDDVFKDAPCECVEEFLENVMDFKLSQISYMLSDEEPKNTITLKEYIEQSEIETYDKFRDEAKRLIEEYNSEN